MSVYLPADKNFLYVKFKDPATGKWVKKATQFKPGQEREAEAEKRRLAGVSNAPLPKYTVHAWAEEWLRRRSNEVNDWENDRARLEHHVLPAIGNLLLDDVRPLHLVDIVDTSAG
jgi:hypothetical protein